jgi:hypothetical protein
VRIETSLAPEIGRAGRSEKSYHRKMALTRESAAGRLAGAVDAKANCQNLWGTSRRFAETSGHGRRETLQLSKRLEGFGK